ncbi:MAG TPA: NACHT domain-containing protein, partial [Myxococcaceae bacterium]|nr:NACHT domain-containing protein [Myxococcaceae bacterium]
MNRYEPVVQKVMGHVDLLSPGIGILVVAPGQHALVARVLESKLPGAVSTPLEQGLLREGPARWIVTGLSGDRAAVEAALSELNGRRNWISSSGRLLVLLLTRRELVEVQRLAGDVYSARLFAESVPFMPDPEVDAEAARAELAQWQRNRFGRLDLRGFVRSESEDVSWRVEDVYQELRASYSLEALFGQGAPGIMQEGAVTELLSKAFRAQPERMQPVVLLGHPGSGKTFFLRWLAMSAVEQERLLGLERPLPLLTSLSAYAQGSGGAGLREHFVESLLENEQPAAHLVERAIQERRVLFLLDGLDEVGDASSRRRMASAIEALIREAPGCPVIVTSRIAGYDAVHLSSLNFFLSPFTDSAIERFLIRWSELYALNRLGETPQAQAEGHQEGEQLARDVLEHSEVRELARSPLLLTVLAMVHRAGVRLPDHRVELYEHVTRILVERWNRVRSLSRQDVSPPLKAADAVRLLGPVALETMRLGTRGAIPEDSLRGMLQRALANGNLRGLVSAEAALELFR